MLQRQLIFITLCVLFAGNIAQQLGSNDQKWKEDRGDKVVSVQRRQVQPSSLETRKLGNNAGPLMNRQRREQQNSPNPNPLLRTAEPSVTSLANSMECKADIQRYCVKGGTKFIPNLKVLQCVDDLDNAVNLINKECQNLIYKFKYNMTHDVRFDNAAMKFCTKDIKLLEDCNDHTDERGTGRLVSCLYDLLNNITEPACRNFIKQIQSIVFTDWRLSEVFATACLKDITDLRCGRLDDDNDTLPHEQGAVISCLSKSANVLSKNCSKHIYRLAEMQSDDYHLDRALYYACRDDRERLCSQVASGNGRVYRCLYEQKFNSMMSPACREEVHRRQKMVSSNALLDAPLVRACDSEMREHQCVANPQNPDKQLSLTHLLLCLEHRLKQGNQINDGCRRQMLIHRRMLMSDYALSPKIMSLCKSEMIQHCSVLYTQGASGAIDQRGGRMIHCLLNAARNEKNFSAPCLSSIKTLVRAVDPGSDIRADPLLEATCRPVIDAVCSKIKPGDSNIIMCLLDNLKSTRMTGECEDRLMEVSYFMARDWRLTPRLLFTCRKNLIDLCQLPANWTMGKDMKDIRVGKYLSCLYQQKQQLNNECRNELQRLMRIRSQSINLMPEIEDNCIIDLATCKNPEVKGEEIKCLQTKYNKLEEACKAAVRNFTKITMTDPTLDFPLMRACESMIQLFCPNVQGGNENDLLRCLIKQKNNQKMDYRCKAAIEHHQIISLKDQAFLSHGFRQKCTHEITAHCAVKRTKSAVIQCLARLMLQDVLKKQNQLTEACREELKFELLQRSESINIDPSLARACQNDIRRLCSSRTPGNAQILDCLKANRNNVSPICYRRLTGREKIDVVLPGNDYSLTTKCSPMIQKFCTTENKQNLLSCLRRNANRDGMPNECRAVLYQRLMILNTDARFNKDLIENCQNDIGKYCQNEVIDDDDDDESDDDEKDDKTKTDLNDGEVKDRDMGGRIIGCLRSKYANKNADLEAKCITELMDVIETSKLSVQLDVKLYQKCKNALDTNCLGVDKEDCLKVLYQQKKLNDPECQQQVIRIIKEGQADIHVDQPLTIACQADLVKYCNDIPIGNGKQLQCLLKMRKSVTKYCRDILSKRQELWSGISDIDDIDDLARHIVYSGNNRYLYTVIIAIALVIFLAGCVCRPCVRYRRIGKYK